MKRRFILDFFGGVVFLTAGCWLAFPLQVPARPGADGLIPEAGGDHLRIETEHGPLHLWRPERYDQRTAGTVIYIHGYFTSVDRAWTEDRLAAQFDASGRNALFIAIEAPQSSAEDVSWKSPEELFTAVDDLAPFPLPPGPLVVEGHSGAYRTILLWLSDPRVQYVILLDGMYGGQAQFRSWLRPQPRARPHRIVLVSSDTWRQSNRFARPIYGAARRRGIPAKSSGFTLRETHARLLHLRSQYDHDEMVSSGKVIPLLLEISPLRGLTTLTAQTAEAVHHTPLALAPQDGH